ncbi:LCP family protein [Texcoconibacillus texcoconensis]|uniref:Regulatory protein MsrR n=1 Tax=Texcoconibacillus texcoconensis TaxID=1095777 RepID=A0A840QU57_9BACI|nr:LCP family protein [Texcoconibacillus texcoconensis]MBB5174829.1 LCP family protein required for cell wall assembly [Texcoconibacillus texcoconensis]
MTKSDNEHARQPKLKSKIVLLTFLLVMLAALSVAAYSKNQFDMARQESLEQRGDSDTENNEVIFEETEEDEDLDYLHVLLVGLDEESGRNRTDTIMVGQYRPEDGEAKLVSIMRDSYVNIPGYGHNKINAAYALGDLELLRQTIEENFQIKINHYAQVDFDGFERVVDIMAPEGLNVTVDNHMYYDGGEFLINFEPGEHVMDGEDTLQYVRFRSDADNDFGRVERQQEILSKLKDEVVSLSGVGRVPELLGGIEPFIQTNLGTDTLRTYGYDFVRNPVDEIETLRIPVENSYQDGHYNHAGAVLELDFEQNINELHEFLEIDDLSEDISVEDEEESLTIAPQ